MIKRRSFQFQPTCLSCRRKFGLKDNIYQIAASNPVLLHCGHSICCSCFVSFGHMQKPVSCPLCSEITLVEGEGQIELNIYILGNLYESRRYHKNSCYSYNVRMVPAHTQARSNGPVVPHPPAICANCHKTANLVCSDCGNKAMCSNCFAIFHNQCGLSRHQYKSIGGQVVHSLKWCPKHSNKLLEYYCTVDEERICGDCLAVGDHQSHKVDRYSDQVKKLVGDVEEKVKTMQKTNKCLKRSEQYLLSTMKESKDADDKCIEQIRQHFQYLHGILQRRESYLIGQVQSKAERVQNQMNAVLHQIQDRRGQLLCLLSDVKSHLNTTGSHPDSDFIYEKIHEFSDSECYLDSNVFALEMFSSKFDLCESDLAVISNYGNLVVEPEISDLKLLSSDQVDDLQLDDISDDEVDEGVPELELLSGHSSDESSQSFVSTVSQVNGFVPSVSSASSVSSVIRPRKSRQKKRREIPPQPRPLVSNRVPKPRQFSTMNQESVRVSHICNPGEFYVQRKRDETTLSKQEANIKECCQRDKIPSCVDPDHIHIGELYLVYYGISKLWYRGRLMDLIQDASDSRSKTMYHVFYIDYGNSDYVPIELLATLPPYFADLPPFAIRCSLASIDPIDKDVGWTRESITTFEKFVHNNFINMTVFDRNANNLLVDLGEGNYNVLDPDNSTPLSVREALVFLELGCFSHSEGALNKSSFSMPVPSCCKFYKNTLPKIDTTTEVLVNYSESPDSFFIQRVEDFSTVEKMLADLQTAYKSLKRNVGICNPIEGLPCVAKNDDGLWYRARVLGSPGHRRIKVFYVDYGDTDELPHTKVKAITSKFLKNPEMGFHCKLADVLPADGGKKWPLEVIEYFNSFINRKMLKLHIVGHVEQSLLVTAYTTEDSQKMCLNSDLVRKGFAISSGPCSSTTVHVRKQSEKEDSDMTPLQPNLNPKWPENPAPKVTSIVNPPRNAKGEALFHVKVHVSEIVSPAAIYVQLIEKNEEFQKLCSGIRYIYEKSKHVEKEWNVDDMCVVQSNEDKQWHRAVVKEVVSSNELKMFLVDSGRTLTASCNSLRAISSKFRTPPYFAFRCHFVEVLAPGGTEKWPSVATEKLSDIVRKHDFLYLTKLEDFEFEVPSHDRESFPVDLFYEEVTVKGALDPMTTEYHSLTEILLEEGLALPSKARRRNRVRRTSVADAESESVALGGYFNFEPAADESDDSIVSIGFVEANTSKEVSSKSPQRSTEAPVLPIEQWAPPKVPNRAGHRFEVLPTNVTMEGLIYMHDTLSASLLLTTIKNTLNSKYANSLHSARDLYWAPGQACVAQFDLDNCWYRAKVISVSDKIKVTFIDYGNVEDVRPDQLRKDICLLHYPQQGYSCQLFNVAPVDGDKWPVSTLTLIHKIIVEHKCYVTIVVPGIDELPPKVTIEVNEGTFLNDQLVEMGLARSLDERPSSLSLSSQHYDLGFMEAYVPDVGSIVSIEITAVMSPTSFFAQIVCVDEEETTAMIKCQNTMNSLASEWPRVTEPKIGGACCSQFTEDDTWFRAVIVDVDNEKEESVTVMYVDYGNKETVNVDRIRQIPPELMLMPKRAFQCELFQVSPVDTWNPELENKLRQVLDDTDKQYSIRVEEMRIPVQVDLVVFHNNSEEPQLAYQHLVDENLLKLVRKKTWEEIA